MTSSIVVSQAKKSVLVTDFLLDSALAKRSRTEKRFGGAKRRRRSRCPLPGVRSVVERTIGIVKS